MRSFANAFLVAFAIDALLALAFSQLGAEEASGLSTARATFAGLVTLASLPLFVMIGIHPGLRWRIFLPPCLLLSWISMGAMPLPIWFSGPAAGLVVGALEAVFAGMAFWFCRRCNGGQGWLLDDAALRGPSFSGQTAVRFTLLNLLVILPATLAYLAYAAAVGVGHLTRGFVEIRGDGIHLAHREYVSGSRRIHLVAMMHIGDPAFYEELSASLPNDGAIWLAEGVTDDSRLLSDGISYGNIAEGLGLVGQPSLSAAGRELRYADLDVSAFSPTTRKMLLGVGRVLGAESFSEGLAAYSKLSSMSSAEATRTIAALKYDLIDLRNDHLVAELETCLADYEEIVVPWGALHLPGIEHRIRELGFVQDAEQDRRVIRW